MQANVPLLALALGDQVPPLASLGPGAAGGLTRPPPPFSPTQLLGPKRIGDLFLFIGSGVQGGGRRGEIYLYGSKLPFGAVF